MRAGRITTKLRRRSKVSFLRHRGMLKNISSGRAGLGGCGSPTSSRVTFRRKPDRLSLAGCSPAEPASVSPGERRMDSFPVTVKKIFERDILTERIGNTKLEFGIEKDPPRGDEKRLGFHLNEPHLLSKEPRGAQSFHLTSMRNPTISKDGSRIMPIKSF